ncbi:MAG: sigma-70 family RNA polymerase sigma factor [Bacteroidia bacterium]
MPFKLMIDQELIDGCLRRDERSEIALYKKYYPLMSGIAIRYFKDKEMALYEMNYAYLKVLQSLKKFRAESKLATWIRRICINHFIDVLRKENKRSNHIDLDELPELATRDQMEYNWELEELEYLLNGLPEKSALVFNLYVIDGYKHGEIAEILKITEGYSKWHLNRARNLLKQGMEQLKLRTQ